MSHRPRGSGDTAASADGMAWAGFAYSGSTIDSSGYALLQNKDLHYTLINKKSGEDYIGFRVDNADKMVVLDNGNVGVGKTNPGAPLDVKGEIRGKPWYSTNEYT